MYDKHFYEKFAHKSLGFFYGDKIANFIYGESPDLQNETDNIGIEVTRGISQYEAKFIRLSTESIENNLNLQERFERANRMFRKNFLGVIHESNGFVIADPQNGDRGYEIHVIQILEKIKIKIEKLHKLYKKFNTNCLYIFSEFPMQKNQIWVLTDIMNAENMNDYDLYFINAIDRLYIINPAENFEFTCRKYSTAEISEFKKQTQ